MRRFLLTCALLIASGGVGLAQGGDGADAPPVGPAPRADAPGDATAAAPDPTAADEPEKVLAARRIEAIRFLFDGLATRHEEAAGRNDTLLVACLADVLLQLEQLLSEAEGHYTLLLAADLRQDAAERTMRLAAILERWERAQAVVAAADACVGGDMIFLGPATTTVEAPDEPAGDVDFPGDPSIPVVEPPPVGSPYE